MANSLNVRQAGTSLWFIPVVCVLGGIVLSIVTIAVDRAFDFELLPRWLTGGPDASIAVLTTIAASMVSLATLVLTITMVVVQLAMGQFSPRIVQTFLRDKPSQLAIGLFVATFGHAMIALREVALGEDDQVPGLAIAVAYVLVLVSIAMLVMYVNHIGRSLRVSSLIELVGDDTRRLIHEQHPPLEDRSDSPPSDLICAEESAVLTAIDHARLVELATGADCTLHLSVGIGTFVPAGAPIVMIEGDPGNVDADAVRKTLSTGLERTLQQDVAFGFRMLVDVAERSLADSPFTDPTTAVQAIDRLHDGLRQLAARQISDGRLRDPAGTLRLTVPTMTWDDYVHLAFDEIRLAGVGSPQVTRRLIAALQDLLEFAPEDRRPPLRDQLDLVRAAVADLPLAQADRSFAVVADLQGVGPTGSGSFSAA